MLLSVCPLLLSHPGLEPAINIVNSYILVLQFDVAIGENNSTFNNTLLNAKNLSIVGFDNFNINSTQ